MRTNAEKANVKEWLGELSGKRTDSRAKLWKRLRAEVDVPRRSRRDVNLYKINKHSKEGDYVVVPGKVLSVGSMDHSVNVTALEYSQKALEGFKKSGCKVLSIKELEAAVKSGKARINIIK